MHMQTCQQISSLFLQAVIKQFRANKWKRKVYAFEVSTYDLQVYNFGITIAFTDY